MIRAVYRHRGSNEDLHLEISGRELDFDRTDAAARAKFGGILIRIASWLV